MRLKMPSAKCRLRRLGLNDLNHYIFPAFYIIRHTFYHVSNLLISSYDRNILIDQRNIGIHIQDIDVFFNIGVK